jgi:hypothetical protein
MKKVVTFIIYCNVLSTLAFAQHTDEASKIYDAFKSNKFNFPPPPKLIDTVYVGEWDASDPSESSFTGIKGAIIEPHGSVRTVTHLYGVLIAFI